MQFFKGNTHPTCWEKILFPLIFYSLLLKYCKKNYQIIEKYNFKEIYFLQDISASPAARIFLFFPRIFKQRIYRIYFKNSSSALQERESNETLWNIKRVMQKTYRERYRK